MAESEESKMMTKKMKEISSTAPIDIEKGLVIEMQDDEQERLTSLSSNNCRIYKVPERLRSVNEKAYTPKVVAIGPLHHFNKSLKVMEKHKWWYLKAVLRRSSPQIRFEEYIEKIKKQEEKIRSCYEGEEIDLISSPEFVEMILVDAAFIIELFLRHSVVELRDENDRIFNKRWMVADILPDIVLLENQLPFFILEDLLTVVSNFIPVDQSERLSMIDLSCNFFENIGFSAWSLGKRPSSDSKVEHLVDLFRNLHVPAAYLEALKDESPLNDPTIPSITKLHRAGVKLKVGSDNDIFHIEFNSGTLKIPKLRIDDDTELIIRNLLAFEQCHGGSYWLSDYAVILDDLMDTPQDVELLVNHGIVQNWLGDNNEVSTLMNNLCNGLYWDDKSFHFASIYNDLNEYYEKPNHRRMANLKQNYFNTPWRTLSVFAAGLLLLLTLIQTVCSIISLKFQLH